MVVVLLELFCSYVPTLHHLLDQLATVDASHRSVTLKGRIVQVLRLEVFYARKDLKIHLHLDYLPSYHCVWLKGLILVYLFVYLLDLFCLLLHFFLLLVLTLKLVIQRIENPTDCEVNFPEDAFEESAQHVHDGEMHDHEQEDYESIVFLIFPAVVIGSFAPGPLG